jgi:hypothetical protein
MPRNKITDLRNHLFATIEALTDPDSPMDIDRAMAVKHVADAIIYSAKVEVQMTKVSNSLLSDFFTGVVYIEDKKDDQKKIGST